MSKRPSKKETLIVAIELLKRIPARRKISSTELSRQLDEAGFGRGIRTIQRQLEFLSEHFDIERDDRNKPYGYRWKEQANGLHLPMLTAQESLLVSLAEHHLRSLLPAKLMASLQGIFTQAKMNLGPGQPRKNERDWLSKVRIVSTNQPLLPPKIRPGVFDQVSDALYANRWLAVKYENASGIRSGADVMPLATGGVNL